MIIDKHNLFTDQWQSAKALTKIMLCNTEILPALSIIQQTI